MTLAADATLMRETMQLVSDTLGSLPANPVFTAGEWNGDVAHTLARRWIRDYPGEASIMVAALAGLVAHVQRQQAPGCG